MNKDELEMKKFFGVLEYDSLIRMLKLCRFMKWICILWLLIICFLYTVPIHDHQPVMNGTLTVAITLPIHLTMIAFNWHQTYKNGAKATEGVLLLRYKMVPVVIADGMAHILPPIEMMEL